MNLRVFFLYGFFSNISDESFIRSLRIAFKAYYTLCRDVAPFISIGHDTSHGTENTAVKPISTEVVGTFFQRIGRSSPPSGELG